MVRSNPDLHIFNNFSSKDLQVPLTSFVRNVGCCLGLCDGQPDGNNSQKIDYERKQLTSFTADLFPQDPAIAGEKTQISNYLRNILIFGKKHTRRFREHQLFST